MKHKFLLFICLICCFTFLQDLQAQSNSIDLNKTAQYQILPLHNGSFMVAEIINMDQYQRGEANFILYDSLCKDRSNKIILLPWQPVFNGSVSAGNLKIVSFFSAVNNKTVFLTMDSLGQQVNRKELEVKKAMQIPSLTAFSSADGFFIISRSEKQWKDIIITKLDFQYNLLWERQFKQEKDPVTIDKLEKIGDKIFIFKQIRAGTKKYQGSLIVLDEKTGNTLLEKNLTSNQVIKTPTAFMVEGENILVAGLYVKGNVLKDSHCDGIFLSSYTSSGQVNFETFNSWQQEVKQGYIKGGIEASWINEQSSEKAILQSIKKTDKGYMVLAESFKKVFNGADVAALIGSGLVYSMVGVAPFINPQLTSYKVMDMLLYDFDSNGMLKQVKKIEKPQTLRTIPVDLGELKAVNTIQNYEVFDFRFAADGRQTNQESFFYRDYIKKEHCKISRIQLSDLQDIQVHSYYLNGLVPDIKDIKSFDFMQRNSQSLLLHYQTKQKLCVRIVFPKDFL